MAASGGRYYSVETRLEKNKKIEDGHWLWTGSTNNSGYGNIKINNVSYGVHVISYCLANNISYIEFRGSVLHKTFCGFKHCFNPDHLYTGNQSQNMQDKIISGHDHNLNKTHCPKGHQYEEGTRRCKKCDNEHSLQSYYRRKNKALNDFTESIEKQTLD